VIARAAPEDAARVGLGPRASAPIIPRVAGMVLIAALLAGGALGAVRWRRTPRAPSPVWVVRGVTLGMTEEEMAAHFIDARGGSWSAPSGCDGVALEWRRLDPHSPMRWVRFEFQGGKIVALRAHAEGKTSRSGAEATASAVRVERPDGDGTSITIVSRQVAEYRGEAEQIALEATER